MNNSKYLYHISLISTTIVLFLIVASSTVSAATAQSSSPTITENQITFLESDQISPAIHGDKIVWESITRDEYNEFHDIYMYDLTAKRKTEITTSGSALKPAIYGNRIVWEGSYPDANIYMYDLSTKKVTQITTNESWQGNPEIYGDRIVWEDGRNGNPEIYMYDLSTHQETQITADEFYQRSPAIYGDKIVWIDDRNNNGSWDKSDIYMYDLSTSKEIQITNNRSVNHLAIYSDRIVWDDWHDAKSIYMYDLSTKKETQITTSGSAGTPSIYGNRIVWLDDRNGKLSFYSYDLSTNKGTQITNGKLSISQVKLDIYNNIIVWVDDRNGNSDIYMGTISSGETKPKLPVASFSASPTSGYAPLTVKFADKSINGPTSWKWSFGDGTYSTAKNPLHTYSKAGKYTVALTASNAAGSNTLKKSSLINVAAPLKPPVAAFLASPRSGKAPLKVQFTDKSINSPTSWKWSFGDKTYSTQKNPAHIYNKAGKYTVYLTVKNAKGSNTKTVSGYIIVK